MRDLQDSAPVKSPPQKQEFSRAAVCSRVCRRIRKGAAI